MSYMPSVPGEGGRLKMTEGQLQKLKLLHEATQGNKLPVRDVWWGWSSSLTRCYFYLIHSKHRCPSYSAEEYLRDSNIVQSACTLKLFVSFNYGLCSTRLFLLAFWKIRKGKCTSQASFFVCQCYPRGSETSLHHLTCLLPSEECLCF